MKRMALAAAALAVGVNPVPRIREMSPEEREAAEAKLRAQREAHSRSRREYWDSIEAGNAAKADSAINRRTGKPHEHNRAKARRLASLPAGGRT